MFEVNPSGVDFDLGSILWFFVEMLSSVDSQTREFDGELFSRFQIEISRKLFNLIPVDFTISSRHIQES